MMEWARRRVEAGLAQRIKVLVIVFSARLPNQTKLISAEDRTNPIYLHSTAAAAAAAVGLVIL
jgi:hypothetical protein